MRKRILFYVIFCFSTILINAKVYHREYWVKKLTQIVDPVLVNLSNNTLKQNMPVEQVSKDSRYPVTHLEAFGRTIDGISGWLSLPADDTKEGKLRAEYQDLTVKAITNAMNPSSPDYLSLQGQNKTAIKKTHNDHQPIVDAAFFAHGLLRCKNTLWGKFDSVTKQRIIDELKATRRIRPYESNWLLFSAMVEALLLELTGECDYTPVDYAIIRHREWYKGDGWYGDGPDFHFDYYNSIVIQPLLLDILSVMKKHGRDYEGFYDIQLKRSIRHADQLEKLISPEGTYPVIGRSMTYRFGIFQALCQIAAMKKLPEYIKPAQVREALTKVLKRQLVKETFDKDGWLRLGFCGHQPIMADPYISTGSLYFCTVFFLPLSLPADDSFWSDKPEKWSSVRMWEQDKNVHRDYNVAY